MLKDKKIGIKKLDFKMIDSNEVKGVYNKNITVSIFNHFGGYAFRFKNSKGMILSAIFHAGSYGCEEGLFEIMPPDRPKKWKDSVKGYLTFEEVIKWVNKSLK